MALSAPGLGSNLDVNAIVGQLMAVERRPLQNLDRREASFQARLSAFGTLRSGLAQFETAMQGLASASRYQAMSASVSDPGIASASATSAAPAGSYALEVSRLAQAQRLVSAGQASTTAAIGTGTLTLEFGTIGGGTFDSATGTYTGASFTASGAAARTVTIDAATSSLAGIRDAINRANAGVQAAIVNDGSGTPFRLVLTGDSTGRANSLRLSVSGDPALQALLAHNPAGTQRLSETATAQDAALRIGGVAITRATNTVSEAIPGVTLTLNRVSSGAVNVTVARDTSAVQSAVQNFVRAYNDLNRQLSELGAFDPATRRAGPLQGDAALRGLQSQLRGLLNQALAGLTGELRSLSDLGVSFQRDGSLALDNARLTRALGADPAGVAALFAPLGRASDSLVAFVSAGDGVQPGSHALEVTRLATQGSASGNDPVASLTVTAGVNDTLALAVDGTAVSVTLAARSYASVAELAAELQARINGASGIAGTPRGVEVTESGGRITIRSTAFGSASTLTVTGGNAQANLFGSGTSALAGVDAAGSINGVAATGSGQFLASAEGLRVQVLGGALGARGTISWSVGYAARLASFADSQLAGGGSIAAGTTGINRQIAALGEQREALSARLEQTERRLRAQFIALDGLVGRLSQTSAFLSQQIGVLNGTLNTRQS